jgi:hypothetical protein
MAFEFKVEVSVGDVIKFNDHIWQVYNSDDNEEQISLKPITGAGRHLHISKEEIEDRIDFSGNFQLVREDYQSVTDY